MHYINHVRILATLKSKNIYILFPSKMYYLHLCRYKKRVSIKNYIDYLFKYNWLTISSGKLMHINVTGSAKIQHYHIGQKISALIIECDG